MTHWIVMPFVDNWAMTELALTDCLAQTLPDIQILLIDNGSGDEARRSAQQWLLQHLDRARGWFHTPSLPSLSATWNRALKFVWETGANQAWVVNNDVRLHPSTYEYLVRTVHETGAWFVSAVGVTPEQFAEFRHQETEGWGIQDRSDHRGGPDFSCYLMTKACHEKYPFDEHFVPAYTEDCSYHRTLMLDGHGAKIFSVNLPFEHTGSGTLNSLSPEARARKERQISEGSRAYYQKLWGGPPNQERYIRPFGPEEYDHVTNPDLQAWIASGRDVDALFDGVVRIATPSS